MKKRDLLIFLSVLFVALLAFIVRFITNSEKAGVVTVAKNGKTVYSAPLYENKTLRLEGNTVEIKNGSVEVVYADCKNQICVEHKPISKKGESIVCLPNKVIVEIK